VDLCGHATLGSAFVILHYLDQNASEVRFETRSGELRVCRAGDGMLALDFPSRPPVRCADNPALAGALGRPPRELWE
jgi:predicted PhzF superfamily epimerase YddE/YHI9